MKVLLFDMDGVLIEPRGYHCALQETVRLFGLALGYKRVSLTNDDINAFESAGVSSEWDSAAICSALLLVHAWDEVPDLDLPPSVTQAPKTSLTQRPPEFRVFARSLGQPALKDLRPLERAEHLLINENAYRTRFQTQVIQSVLRHARAHQNSLIHCTFQELVLGSQVYEKTYQLPPVLANESYLLAYDLPNLNPQQCKTLKKWNSAPDHRAVIFTGRPSRSPSGVFSPPEAELGAKLVGLEDMPILGLGGLLWLADQHGLGHQAYLKPSPVHVLAALQLALGTPLEDALKRSAQLVLQKGIHPSWRNLDGTQVGVFEDTTAGLSSAIAAKDVLKSSGVNIDLSLYGIAANPLKSQTLLAAGAIPYSSMGEALEHALSSN